MTTWVNGRLVEEREPVLLPNDHGITTGDGVFETMKVVDGVPFARSRHLRRLAASAAGLELHVEPSVVAAGIDEVLAATEPEDARRARLRVTITGGPSPLGSERGRYGPTVIVAMSRAREWPPTADVVTVPWCRNERAATAGLKTISYADNVVALAYAHDRGAGEAIFPNTRGELCEGTGSNVFVARDGALLTPPLSAGCLGGITRELLVEWTEVREQTLLLADLAEAEEAFLTSSTRDVQPIRAVDGRALAAAPGPLTQQVMRVFAERAAQDLDP